MKFSESNSLGRPPGNPPTNGFYRLGSPPLKDKILHIAGGHFEGRTQDAIGVPCTVGQCRGHLWRVSLALSAGSNYVSGKPPYGYLPSLIASLLVRIHVETANVFASQFQI